MKIDDIKLSVAPRKISEHMIEITLEPPDPVVTQYDRNFVEQHLINIQKDMDTYIALKNDELALYQSILDQMDALGIVPSKIDD